MTIEEKWNMHYDLLIKYKEEHGNVDVPFNYEVDGIKLGKWINRMRVKYNKGELDNKREEKLNSLGLKWRINRESDWDSYYNLLIKYKEEFKNIDVPKDYVVDGIKLGNWLVIQRKKYRGKYVTKLLPEQIEKLNKIGIKWDMKNKLSWDNYYELLAAYKEQYGNVDVPFDYEVVGIHLGQWLVNQRKAYHGDKHRIITEEQVEKLNKLGIKWRIVSPLNWDECYSLLIKYKEEHGNINVPQSYVVNDIKLGLWLVTQKKKYKNNILEDEYIVKLNKLDIDWSINETKKLNKSIINKEYEIIMYKKLKNVLRDLQLENINEIHCKEEQKEIEKTIVKRLFG